VGFTGVLVFRLASGPADDQAIRELVRRTPTTGAVQTVFAREPSYLGWAGSLGNYVQVLVAERDGEIVAVAVRAIRTGMFNGQLMPIGYLGDLRIRVDARAAFTLHKGFEFLQGLDSDNRCDLYSTVIAEQNHVGLSVLTSRRAGLPVYVPCGRVNMYSIALTSNPATRVAGASEASLGDIPQIVELLNSDCRQFAPRYTKADLLENGCTIADFSVTRRSGRVTGVMAVWDPQHLCQSVIVGYDPLVEAVLRACGQESQLPPVGTKVATVFARFVLANTAEDFAALLSRACELAKRKGYDRIAIALGDNDSAQTVVETYADTKYPMAVFSVSFRTQVAPDGRPCHLDPALV
jgi:hypothetical protein